MLADDARSIAAAIGERLTVGACRGVTATVKAEQMSPKTIPAGAGRPTFTNYYIKIEDGTRMAVLTLGQAAALLDEVEPEWDPDRLFEAIRALSVLVEDTN